MQKTAAREEIAGPSSRGGEVSADASARDLRCDCGKLLARVLHSVLELKCPRCKRVVLVVGGRRFAATDAGACACPPEPPPLI